MAKKIYVNQHACIACGRCFKYIPDFFDLDDEGLAFVRPNNSAILSDAELAKNKQLQKSIIACPTKAIISKKIQEDD